MTSFMVKAVEPNPVAELNVIVSMADSKRYLQTWVSTSPETSVPIPRLNVLKPNQVGYAAFIVTGIEGDEVGNFKYSVSWKLIGPAGELVYEFLNYAKGEGKLHHKAAFYMADPALDIILENSDPSGNYKLEVTAVDQVSGRTALTSYNIEFKKSDDKAL